MICNICDITVTREGRFDDLEHFKDIEQAVQVKYTAETEHSFFSQGMPEDDVNAHCGASAHHLLEYTTKRPLKIPLVL